MTELFEPGTPPNSSQPQTPGTPSSGKPMIHFNRMRKWVIDPNDEPPRLYLVETATDPTHGLSYPKLTFAACGSIEELRQTAEELERQTATLRPELLPKDQPKPPT